MMFIIDSFKKAWKGEEKLWIVFWFWGVLGISAQFIITILLWKAMVASIDLEVLKNNRMLINFIFGIIGYFQMFLYAPFALISIKRCVANSKHRIYTKLTKIITTLLWFSLVLFWFGSSIFNVFGTSAYSTFFFKWMLSNVPVLGNIIMHFFISLSILLA